MLRLQRAGGPRGRAAGGDMRFGTASPGAVRHCLWHIEGAQTATSTIDITPIAPPPWADPEHWAPSPVRINRDPRCPVTDLYAAPDQF